MAAWRSVLRHIRVASKQELKDRIMAAMDFFNHEPSSTPGPTSSTPQLDMIRTLERSSSWGSTRQRGLTL